VNDLNPELIFAEHIKRYPKLMAAQTKQESNTLHEE